MIEKINKETIIYDNKNEFTWQIKKTWCEGKEDDGIGEYIVKKAHFKTNKIVLINGFVDAIHPDYYMKNNRIKEIELMTEKETYNYILKDTSQIQIIDLPEQVEGDIKLVIKNVYKGLKYTDTCLSGMYFLYESPKK